MLSRFAEHILKGDGCLLIRGERERFGAAGKTIDEQFDALVPEWLGGAPRDQARESRHLSGAKESAVEFEAGDGLIVGGCAGDIGQGNAGLSADGLENALPGAAGRSESTI